MDAVYRLTDALGPIDEVNALEQVQGSEGTRLEKGTEFRIYRQKHKWAVPGAPESDHYTIQVGGKHFNVLANQLEPRMRSV